MVSRCIALPLAAAALLQGAPRRTVPKRPNILVILTDDLGARDLGCDGSSFHRTPNLDRLAKEGVRFTQATAASPVSSPSRASLLTGRHPARLGITDWIGATPETKLVTTPENVSLLPEDAPTLGEVFTEAGYRTGYLGKWHLGIGDAHPKHRGFGWTLAVNGAGEPASHFAPFQKPMPGLWDVPDLEESPDGSYLADRLTEGAKAFLDTPDAKPFFLVLSHYAVHTPLQAPAEAVAEQKARAAALPPLEDPLVEDPKGGFTRRRQDHPTYAAMVENLDANVGRVLDHLKARGLEKNTLVVFLSDNGGMSTLARRANPATSNTPLRAGKGWLFEGGLRIPLILRGPGAAKGKTSPARVGTSDLMPTLLELAGLPQRPGVHRDGQSFAPVLKGKALPPRSHFWHYPHYHGSGSRPGSAVQSGSLKLIQSLEDGSCQLYDLAKDPGERNDLASARPKDVERLRALLDQWRSGIKASMPLKTR